MANYDSDGNLAFSRNQTKHPSPSSQKSQRNWNDIIYTNIYITYKVYFQIEYNIFDTLTSEYQKNTQDIAEHKSKHNIYFRKN